MKSSFKLKGLSPDSDKKLNQAVVEGLKAKLRLPAGLYVTYRPADEQAEIFTPVEAIQGTDRVKQYLKVDYQEEVAVYANSDTVLDLKQATLESDLFADGDRITIDAYSSPVTRKLEITFCSHKRNWLEDIKTELSKSIVLKDSVSVTYPVDENTVEFMDHLRRTKANKVTPDSSWNTIDKYFPIDKRTVSSNCLFTSKVTFISNITENSMYFLTVKLDVTYNHVLWLVVSYPPVLNNTLINPKYIATDVVYSTEVKDIVKEIGKGHSRYLLDPKDTFLNIPVTDTWFTARVSRKYTPLVTVLLTLGTNRKNLGKLKDLPGIKITEAYCPSGKTADDVSYPEYRATPSGTLAISTKDGNTLDTKDREYLAKDISIKAIDALIDTDFACNAFRCLASAQVQIYGVPGEGITPKLWKTWISVDDEFGKPVLAKEVANPSLTVGSSIPVENTTSTNPIPADEIFVKYQFTLGNDDIPCYTKTIKVKAKELDLAMFRAKIGFTTDPTNLPAMSVLDTLDFESYDYSVTSGDYDLTAMYKLSATTGYNHLFQFIDKIIFKNVLSGSKASNSISIPYQVEVRAPFKNILDGALGLTLTNNGYNLSSKFMDGTTYTERLKATENKMIAVLKDGREVEW